MKTLLSKLGYSLNVTTQVWSRADYEGIAYNDGDEIENNLATVIAQAQDISVLSTELRQHCLDWPSTYHLSAQRSNLLRPFQSMLADADVLEIGSGCGAITRYLGECGANVLALEGTIRRAAMTRARTRDLDNVTVVSEQFDQFKCEQKFDVITLIGVLEYAKVFMPGTCPVQAMLQRVKAMLKPQGQLIIAIENQLGLKYFSGAPEDHIGQPMYGLEGHYRDNQPTTYGRQILVNHLQQAGFADSQFFAPLPDYKLPSSIISERGFSCNEFDAGTLAALSVRHDPQLPAYLSFSPELVWPSLAENKIALDLANSFLIVAQISAVRVPAADILAYHYATQRASAFCKETLFIQTETGTIDIQYNLLAPKARSTLALDGVQHYLEQGATYIAGKLLSAELVKIITQDGWCVDEVGAFFKRYLSTVASLITQSKPIIPIDSIDTLLPAECIDLLPQNIMLDAHGVAYAIDNEWIGASQIPAGYLIFRSLLGLMNMVSRFGRPTGALVNTWMSFFLAVYKAMGFEVNEDLMLNYLAMEDSFQSEVTQYPFDLITKFSELNVPICTANLNKLAQDQTIHIQDLQHQLADQSRHIQHSEFRISELESQVVDRETEIAALASQVRELDFRATELNAQVTELNAQVTELNTQVTELNAHVTEKNRRIQELMNKFPRSVITWLDKKRTQRKAIKICTKSSLFDAEWYLTYYPDVKKAGMNPAKHFVVFGAAEGRDPGPCFSTRNYLLENPTVKERGINPLLDFEKSKRDRKN